MSTSGVTKAQKSRSKALKSRPKTTFSTPHGVAISQGLSRFSQDGSHFAFLSLSVDKHRLRIYNTQTSQSIAENVVESGRVTCLQWAHLDLTGRQGTQASGSETVSPSKKKRKTRDTTTSETKQASPGVHVVLLGLSDGSISCFSHSHGRVVRVLSHTKNATPVHAIATSESPSHMHSLWSTGADGTIFCWDVRTGEVIGTWKFGSQTPHSAIAIRPSMVEDAPLQLVAAHRSIQLLSLDPPHLNATSKVKEMATFTGHASLVSNIHWESSSRFVTSAESDRFLYVWEVPDFGSIQGRIVFSAPLDSEVRSLSLSASHLLAISANGRISIFSLPSDSSSSTHVVNLEPLSTVAVSYKKASSEVEVVAALFLPRGQLRIATVWGGVKPVFDTVRFQSPDGKYLSEVNALLQDTGNIFVSDPANQGPPGRRYAEPSNLKIHSGVELGQDPAADNPVGEIEGALDVDLAELSLGQRLAAVSGGDEAAHASGSSESESEEGGFALQPNGKSGKSKSAAPDSVPASSLTRTLIQALHSSDSRLLETCLSHSEPLLIRGTVRKLPPQLAVPLLTACVDRLGRGNLAANMKGGGGGASSQRGISLITWVKVVLTVHSGHLMTMPDLIMRLSGLHTVLTSRLALQESLLNLSGRLDMAVSQMEARSSNAPTVPTTVPKAKQPTAPHVVERYVEGESDNEAEEEEEVDLEMDDDGGSREDIELGGFDNMEEDEDEEEGEDDSDEDGHGLNGFIDEEAEEDYSEDEDEEDLSE